jgi:hypothetical protein
MKSNRGVLAISKLWKWLTVDFLGIFKEMRLSYIPPLMVYLAAGVSGFTGIIESFFIKDTLGLSAAFLAGLAFWAGLPWALKMPLGHLVDFNKIFVIERGQYDELGMLMITVTILSLILPILTVVLCNRILLQSNL